jgi:PD-(D/E)XK nuclease superfamily
MVTKSSIIDAFGSFDFSTDTVAENNVTPNGIVPKKLDYIIEPNIIALSYSKLQTAKTCPRMFLLKEMMGSGSYTPSIDTAYGHAWAAGVQELFRSESICKAMLALIDAWDYAYFESPYGDKAAKSMWSCIMSLQIWYETQFSVLTLKYKLAVLGNKPAIELFIYMRAGQFSYQVHIDLVLEDRFTEELVVTEIKTSGLPQQRANWENSSQTLGYYTFIKAIAAGAKKSVHPQILYIVQQTGKLFKYEENNGFFLFPFVKSVETPVEFMQAVNCDIRTLELYIESQYFPKYGQNCVRFGKPCYYFGSCDDTLVASTPANHYLNATLEDADFVLEFEQILDLLEVHD